MNYQIKINNNIVNASNNDAAIEYNFKHYCVKYLEDALLNNKSFKIQMIYNGKVVKELKLNQ